MSEFADYLTELFSEFGVVSVRRMFGGYGLFHDGVMFGLVDDEVVYLKTDETLSEQFRERDLEQFEYAKGEKRVKMSYWRAPDEIYDDPESAAAWARRSFEVAFRDRNKTPARKQRAGRARS